MLISLKWIQEFVDLPASLAPQELGERFTLTCAEVEVVERIATGADGLIAARVLSHKEIPGTRNLRHAVLDVGNGRTVETVTAAPVLYDGVSVVYAPPGASVAALGPIRETTIEGQPSLGMILPGDALGMSLAVQTAVFLPPSTEAGESLPGPLFDDWIIEVDNKSITHRPDLWGHYGIAREMAALCRRDLKPYPVVPMAELAPEGLPEIPIEIDDASFCPRYSGLRLQGVGGQAAPLWMQLRLGHLGLRPIDCLVDLTNFIMCELGQPMHAFDGDKVDRIEVGFGEPGSPFVTLDGMERTLPEQALMILCQRRPIALAGIMGGLETEIRDETESLLLESANFEPATIRRCAAALGLRTDACVRFEKSLDPANTVLAIQRFMQLARTEFPDMALASRLSDGYPQPAAPIEVTVDPHFVARFMGYPIEAPEMIEILEPLGFSVREDDEDLRVSVPSWRATKDVTIEADVIEEIARYVGYNNIEPVLPENELRSFDLNAQHAMEQHTLRLLCEGLAFNEIHDYIWYDAVWIRKLGFDPGPCIELRNPAAAGMELLRQTLMPGLLASVERNRHHFDDFKLAELGGVFVPGDGESDSHEHRHLGVVIARRQKGREDDILAELKGVIEVWTAQVLRRDVEFRTTAPDAARPWEHRQKTAGVRIGNVDVGKASALPLGLRLTMDEHLKPWSIAWAELQLDALPALSRPEERLQPIAAHPEVELDFSFLVDLTLHYSVAAEKLRTFDHSLLHRMTYVGSYEGKSVPDGQRSLTVRCRIGDANRTLVDEDIASFRSSFEAHLEQCGWPLRR